jgi:hypothetical protein
MPSCAVDAATDLSLIESALTRPLPHVANDPPSIYAARSLSRNQRDDPPAAPAATLHSHIAHLRRILEPNRSSRDSSKILKSVQNGYQLVVAPKHLDAAVFESRLRTGRAALSQGQPHQASRIRSQLRSDRVT